MESLALPTLQALLGFLFRFYDIAMAASSDTAVKSMALLASPSRIGRETARGQRAWLVERDIARYPPAIRDEVLRHAEVAANYQASRDSWLREWFTLDPRFYAAKQRGRALVVHGTRDAQVPVSQADELSQALKDAGVQVSLARISNVNHLLLTDTNGDPDGYVRLSNRKLDASVARAFAQWLAAN